jgi:hypothetical protein
MSRVLAIALAIVGCLIGAYSSVNTASADGPLGGLGDSGLIPATVDTHIICCAPIVATDPQPVLEPLPVPLVEDALEPILQSDLLDVIPDTPIIDIPRVEPVIPLPVPEPPEVILPPVEELQESGPRIDNQVPASEPASPEPRADARDPSAAQATKSPREGRASSLARPARTYDRTAKPDAGLPQPVSRELSDPADIPTSRFSPARLLAPFDGAGLFKTTAGRDSILAVSAALPALAGLWAWLRRQQRQRDRVLLGLANSLHDQAGVFIRRLSARAAGHEHSDDQSLAEDQATTA